MTYGLFCKKKVSQYLECNIWDPALSFKYISRMEVDEIIELKDIIYYAITLVSIGITGIFSYQIIKVTRLFGSPLPCVKPTVYSNYNFKELELRVKNLGPGHATDVRVKILIKKLSDKGSITTEYIELAGPNFLPYIDENVKYCLPEDIGRSFVVCSSSEVKVNIKYKSMTGNKIESTWLMQDTTFITSSTVDLH